MFAYRKGNVVEDCIAGDHTTSGVGLDLRSRASSCFACSFDRRTTGAIVRTGLALLVVIGALALGDRETWAQVAGQQPVPDRTTVEQKLKLLEKVLVSPKMSQTAAGGDADGAVHVQQARRAAEEARNALAAGEVQRAATLIDEGLKACSTASIRAGRTAEEDAHLRSRNREMLEEVMSYRVSLVEAVRARGGARGEVELERIDQMIARSCELTAANRQADAGKLLHQVYGLVVGLLSELRAGQTIVLALKFDSPADEFAHEQKTHGGNVALVLQMMREDRINPERRPHLDRYLRESLEFRAEAEDLASRANFPAAIKLMEKANHQLLNAVMSASGLTSF